MNIEQEKRSRKSILLVILTVILSIAGVVAYVVLNRDRGLPHDGQKAASCATSIKLALIDFEDEYGLRPGEAVVHEINGGKADTANDCFRQLIQGSSTLRSEAIFFAPSRISKRPDGDVGTMQNNFAQACARGEVGFLYVDAPFATDEAPLIAAPLSKIKGEFDYEAYRGKAVILRVNGKVDIVDIDRKTKLIYTEVNGKKVDMFSKENPVFGDDFKIKYPEPREKR